MKKSVASRLTGWVLLVWLSIISILAVFGLVFVLRDCASPRLTPAPTLPVPPTPGIREAMPAIAAILTHIERSASTEYLFLVKARAGPYKYQFDARSNRWEISFDYTVFTGKNKKNIQTSWIVYEEDAMRRYTLEEIYSASPAELGSVGSLTIYPADKQTKEFILSLVRGDYR